MDAVGLFSDERRLEQHFRATEPFAADRDDVTIGEFIRFLLLAALRRRLFWGLTSVPVTTQTLVFSQKRRGVGVAEGGS